jgi:lipopolysaccharide heptosyltransferase II
MDHSSSTDAPLPPRLRLLRWALAVVAALARVLLHPVRRPASTGAAGKTETVRQILVVRLDELGDMVLFSGFFRELKRRYPKATVTVVAKSAAADVLESSPHIDRLLRFEPRVRRALRPLILPILTWRFARRFLATEQYDLGIQPRWDTDYEYGGWIVYFAGARSRVSYSEGSTTRKSIFNSGFDQLYTSLIEDQTLMHESDRATACLAELGIGGDATETEVWPRLPTADRISELLPHSVTSGAGPIVTISPASGHSRLKLWPVERFGSIARELVTRFNATVVLLASDSERPLADRVVAAAGVPLLNLAGRTSLADAVAIIDRSALYVGNDTGLLHIAAARGIPTVSLYGSSTPVLFAPRGPQHQVIWQRLPCGPYPLTAEEARLVRAPHALTAERCLTCIYSSPLCMEQITVERVLEGCLEGLRTYAV